MYVQVKRKSNLSIRVLGLLLLFSLAGNCWQLLSESPPFLEGKEGGRQAKNRLYMGGGMREETPSGKAGKVAGGGSVAAENIPVDTQEASAPVVEGVSPLAERRPVPGDWMTPLPEERISNHLLQSMLTEASPEGDSLEISIQISEGAEVLEEVKNMKVKMGQKSTFENIRKFPFPTEFDPPQPASPDVVVPFVSRPRESPMANRDIGSRMEFKTSVRGKFIFIEGLLTSRNFSGWETAAGLPFRPIEDEQGTLLTDNKFILPQFTTYEMPFFDAVQMGEALQMPVPSLKGNAVMEIQVHRVFSE